MPPDFRRALAISFPTGGGWRWSSLLSGLNTALTLTLPYLTKTLVDGALIGREPRRAVLDGGAVCAGVDRPASR